MKNPLRSIRKLLMIALGSGASLLPFVSIDAQAQIMNRPDVLLPPKIKSELLDIVRKNSFANMEKDERIYLNKYIMNESYVRQAQSLLLPNTKFTRDLDSLQQSVQDYVDRENPYNADRITIFNLLALDIAEAFNMPTLELIAMQYPRKTFRWSDNAENLAYQMTRPLTSIYGDTTFTARPVSTVDANGYRSPRRATLMIPMDNDGFAAEIPGLTRQQTVDYANFHESWHLRDNHYGAGKIRDRQTDSTDVRNMKQVAYVTTTQEVFLIYQKGEAFADLGAIGDMLRRGDDISVIDHIMKWRSSATYDVMHMTQMPLDAFRDKVKKMGIDRFKAMTDKDREAMYVKIVEETALTTISLSLFVRYKQGEITAASFFKPNGPAVDDHKLPVHIRQAIDFNNTISKEERPEKDYSGTMNMQQMQIKAELDKWDVITTLIEKAYANDHAVTPVSLARAYADLRTELINTSDIPAQKELAQAKIIRLRNVFTRKASEIDFVKENTDRKVPRSQWLPSIK